MFVLCRDNETMMSTMKNYDVNRDNKRPDFSGIVRQHNLKVCTVQLIRVGIVYVTEVNVMIRCDVTLDIAPVSSILSVIYSAW